MKCRCLSHDGFLTDRGYAEVAQRESDRLEVDAMELSLYVDTTGSVSGLRRDETHWDHELLDQQYRRFHCGS